MVPYVVIFVLSAVACSEAINATAACPIGYTAFQSSCYGYIDHKMAWLNAQSTCAALGGFLAEALTEEEGKFLHHLAKTHGSHSTWLGADDLLREGLWMWVTSGTLVQAYTDWHHGQPENDPLKAENCLEMEFKNYGGDWNDDECDHEHRFICQRPPGSTITVG